MPKSKPRKTKAAHTFDAAHMYGDYYGSGIKNKVGIPRSIDLGGPMSKKKLKIPPKRVA